MALLEERSVITHTERETIREARRLASRLQGGDIVILTGELGAGKTVFVRGLAEGLGIDPRQVHSPSFTILTEYGPAASGRRLVHVDLYRIELPAEVEDLGLDECLGEDRVMAVEWGEKLPARLRSAAVTVALQDASGHGRRVTIRGPRAGPTA